MPVYEYVCNDCEQSTEAIRRMADADEPMVCEHCGSKRTQRALSKVAISSGSPDFCPPSGCCPCGDPGGPCNT